MRLFSLMLWFSLSAFAGVCAADAEPPAAIQLAAPPAIGKGFAAFPRIAAPDGPQTRRINQARAARHFRPRHRCRRSKGIDAS
jgi:hypothetical protein